MNNSKKIINQFSKHLFWDIDPDNLVITDDQDFIVKRVLEYGILNDWVLLNQQYGLEGIISSAVQLRELDDISLNFISTLSGIPPEKFRCYTWKSFQKPHWNY